jgi:hypothetical protein
MLDPTRPRIWLIQTQAKDGRTHDVTRMAANEDSARAKALNTFGGRVIAAVELPPFEVARIVNDARLVRKEVPIG